MKRQDEKNEYLRKASKELAEKALGSISDHDVASIVEAESLERGLEQHICCHWGVGGWDGRDAGELLSDLVAQKLEIDIVATIILERVQIGTMMCLLRGGRDGRHLAPAGGMCRGEAARSSKV